MYLKYSFIRKRAKKNVQKREKSAKRASQNFLDPIQKRASSRSVQLEAVQLKALLYRTMQIHIMRGPSNIFTFHMNTSQLVLL